MKKNIKEIHEKSKKVGIYKCDVCENKVFKTKKFLEQHKKRRHFRNDDMVEENEINDFQSDQEKKVAAPNNLDENKIINEITSKLNDELNRIQFNLQLEFNEKLKSMEEQSKENFELVKASCIVYPNIKYPEEEKETQAMNELSRLNESLKFSQNYQMETEKKGEEIKKSIIETQKSIETYDHKLKRLNKNMKKIIKGNQTFQKSFFKNLKEYQNNLQKSLIEEGITNRKEEKEKEKETEEILYEKSSPSSEKKMQLLKIPLTTHIGELLSDDNSVNL